MNYEIEVCRGSTCGEFFESDVLGIVLEKTKDRPEFVVKIVDCLDNCSNAPCIKINGEMYHKTTPKLVGELIDNLDNKLL